ncbi:hypothetical protein [Bradyrhizobium sp.]|uniref:hypothetical protein n=1 Tax=Bradyrhizobium sp. TaxID=376 RepID=UPI003C4FB34D
MDVSIPSLALGAGAVGIVYFLYLCATKGVPAAWAWLKAKLASASAEISKLRADLAQLEKGAVADVTARVAALETDVAGLKKTVAAPNVATPAAPATPAAEPAAHS